MKIINTTNTYDIYDDSLKVFDQLIPQAYIVRFSKNSGFWLEKYVDIEVREAKIYGVQEQKVNKILSSFKRTDRNLGVILSGDKGIGKTLFARLLAKKGIEEGYPLIVIDKYYPGIASYIEKIEQEVIVLFDEFDKTFGGIREEEGSANPQTELLALFDGISQGKKLFVITCNILRNVSNYIVNRPGRCHYHLRFSYPSPAEIEEYLKDKLDEQYYEEIPKVIAFSGRIELNYDCLRAIAFELNGGESFEAVIKDLNIVNVDDIMYKLTLVCADGTTFVNTASCDLFNPDEIITKWLYDNKGNSIYVNFNSSNCHYDPVRMVETVDASKLSISGCDENDENEERFIKSIKPLYLTLTRKEERRLHYAF